MVGFLLGHLSGLPLLFRAGLAAHRARRLAMTHTTIASIAKHSEGRKRILTGHDAGDPEAKTLHRTLEDTEILRRLRTNSLLLL